MTVTTNLSSAIAKREKRRKLSALQQRMQKRVDSGNFRMLNETMYTTTGQQALELMRDDPMLFQVYHAGYSEQVKRWPNNPLDDIIRFLRTQSKRLVVADLGCGEARLAKEIPQKVHSFDLVAVDDSVVECDIANVPLSDSSVDVAVFCLSLMGTNYDEYLREARRILVPKGLLVIAEVASRFEEQSTATFVTGVQGLGFKVDHNHVLLSGNGTGVGERKKRKGGGRKKKKKNTDKEDNAGAFFFKFVFRSTKAQVVGDDLERKESSLPKLAACLYKKR